MMLAPSSVAASRPPSSFSRSEWSVRQRKMDGWHCLQAVSTLTLKHFSDASPEGLLAMNAHLPVAVKFAQHADGQAAICAELPCSLHNIESEIENVMRRLEGTVHTFVRSGEVPAPPTQPSSDTLGSDRSLEEACAIISPDAVVQPDSHVVVPLIGTPEPQQAHLRPLLGAGWQVDTELTSLAGAPDVSRHAIAVFLLRLAARLRWARPALRGDQVLLEIQSPSAVEPADVKDALACLSFACSRYGLPTRALLDEAAARLFSEVVV